MDSPPSGERSVPLQEAERRIMRVLAGLGLEPELSELSQGRDLTAWSCRLLAYDGTMPPMAQGMGKGCRDEARVGALFEALEHYITGPELFDPTAVELAWSFQVASSGPLRDDVCALLLGRAPNQRLSCCRYRCLADDLEVAVPLFLSAPWYVETHAAELRTRAADAYDYGDLIRYSCNSGSAIGVTCEEALVHAVNETIERDALSLLLAGAFLSSGGFQLSLVDPATLPDALALAYSAAEDLTGSRVHLLDITSDLGVPSMLAYTPPTSQHPHRRGTGTSLSPTYAAWRALTELFQTTMSESSRPGPTESSRGELTGLVNHPALYTCGRCDLSSHLRDARMVAFTRVEEFPDRPCAHLQGLTTILAAHGYTPYYRRVATLTGGMTTVHVIVPGLERFMLITDGNLVLPGSRGRAAARGRRAYATNGRSDGE